MVHITFTGNLAGVPLCGTNKEDARGAGDTFQHMPYRLNEIELFLSRDDLCEMCRAAWLWVEEEDTASG